jgi:PiT family inorganic phosphate transporter
LGGIAISVGIFTYSQKVIKTIGNSIMKMSPLMAFVVVVSQGLVLFLFSSQDLYNLLSSHNLPTIPLVPVSSTQAVVGAVIGIGIAKGGNDIHWNILGKIVLSWIVAPLLSALICYISLFFLQNVFNMVVYK